MVSFCSPLFVPLQTRMINDTHASATRRGSRNEAWCILWTENSALKYYTIYIQVYPRYPAQTTFTFRSIITKQVGGCIYSARLITMCRE